MRILPLTLVALGAIATLAGGYYLGQWSERQAWRHARQYVAQDLQKRGLNPQLLGPTEIIERTGKGIEYGFTYSQPEAHIDYVVSFTGPRGIEMSYWDHARTD